MACCCRWNRRCSPGKGNAVSHRKVSLTSELHVIQKNCVIKKNMGLKEDEEVISSILESQYKINCPWLFLTDMHCSLPKLGDRTHRFSFLTVEAESLLKKLKPITLVVTTGDMNSLVLYSLQLFTFWCLLSVFSTLNYPNCFKLSPSVLLSRSLIIPCWSPLASFETGPHFFWNAV